VVEAGLRSGSLNTARIAAEHGRVVASVPGPVTSMMSAGCHEAIRSGMAQLVTDAAEAAEAEGWRQGPAVRRLDSTTMAAQRLSPLFLSGDWSKWATGATG
jgi:DNA processing protein